MTREPDQTLVEDVAVQEFALAEEFLAKLHVLIRNARTHHRNNTAQVQAAKSAEDMLMRLLAQCDAVRFDFVSDCVFFNSTRIKTDAAGYGTIKHIVEETKAMDIRAIVIDDAAEAEDILSLAVAFTAVPAAHPNPFREMERILRLDGVAGIQLHQRKKGLDEFQQDGALMGQSREQAKHAFFSALHVVKEAVSGGIAKGTVNPRKVKRVVETVVDSILSDEESILALTYMRDYDEYTYYHSLNVCIYTIALANRLNLPRQALCEIGIAALFHDIGKTYVPRSVLNQCDSLTDDEWRQIRGHTTAAVQVLAQLKKIDRTSLRALIVAFCHHMNIDRSGYPQTVKAIKPDTASRIVRIADVYDALTGARSYRIRPFTRAEALEILQSKSAKELDPVLCTVFAGVVGAIPENPGERRTGNPDP